jgi:hypothetical protein
MVDATDLPATLSGLARRNATRLDRGSFAADAGRILDAVQRIVDTADLRRSGRSRNRTDPPPDGTPDSIEEIAAALAARNRRRTRRWWGTYVLAMLLVEDIGSVVVAQSPAAKLGASWGLLTLVLFGLSWGVVALRREIAAQRLLVGQLPVMARIERIRRAVSPGHVRVVAVICVVAALVVGLGTAVSGSRQPATGTAEPTTGSVR